MALYRCQIILNMDDGLAENAATNTLYFDADTEDDLVDVQAAVQDFYVFVDGFMSSLIDTGNVRTEYYRLSDPSPRQPVFEGQITGMVGTTTASPTELAIVLSYQGERVSGLPQARRRGRIFLGPLSGGNVDRPSASQVSVLRGAAINLLDASNAATGWTWAQYSPTNGIGIDVNNGWVDNEWDTQRRRGRRATERNAWTASP